MPRSTSAQSELTYQQATAQGLSAYAAGEYARARALFERAHALDPNARTSRALGLTSVNLKRYEQARRELQTALRGTRQPLTQEQRVQVGETLRWMDASLSMVQVVVTPPDAHVSIDGEPVSNEVTLDPGKHNLRVEAAGYAALERSFACEPAQHRTLELALQRLDLQPKAADVVERTAAPLRHPDAAPSDESLLQRWWFWTALGAVVVAGGAVAVIAVMNQSDPGPPGRLVKTLTVSY